MTAPTAVMTVEQQEADQRAPCAKCSQDEKTYQHGLCYDCLQPSLNRMRRFIDLYRDQEMVALMTVAEVLGE